MMERKQLAVLMKQSARVFKFFKLTKFFRQNTFLHNSYYITKIFYTDFCLFISIKVRGKVYEACFHFWSLWSPKRIDIFSTDHPVLSNCQINSDSLSRTVSGSCEISQMFSSDGLYTCIWTISDTVRTSGFISKIVIISAISLLCGSRFSLD